MTKVKKDDEHAKKCSDLLEIMEAASCIQSKAISGEIRGSLTILFDDCGEAIESIEAGSVKRNPYRAQAAAQRVAERLSWR